MKLARFLNVPNKKHKPTESVTDERWQAMCKWLNRRVEDQDLRPALIDNKIVKAA